MEVPVQSLLRIINKIRHINMKENYIIGLDIGSNSVGWAIVRCIKEKENGQWRPTDLIDLNSYIFQEVVESKTQVPLNAVRRQKRLARRQTKRRARRRRELTALLRQYGLIPESENESPYISEEQANSIDKKFAHRLSTNTSNQEEQKKHQNPFAIRAIGIEQQLEPYELGRAILHLQSHRGYRSNEGAKYVELLEKLELGESLEDQDDANESADDKKEKKKVLGGISKLEKEMTKANVETVGQYIWHRIQNGEELNRITGYSVKITETKDGKEIEHDVALYARRDMTRKEFNMLWNKQKRMVQKTLDTNDIEEPVDDVRDEIEKLLFEQYPVQSPPPAKYRQRHLSYNAVGKCTLEPKKNRCRAAWPEAQEFRTRQVINNLKKYGEDLSPEQKEKLFSATNDIANLNKDGRLSWTKVAQYLGYQKKDLNYHDDGDSKSGLVGNRTKQKIHSVIGDNKDYKEYIEDMLTIVNKRALYDRLVKLGLSEGKEGEALKLTMLELEPSYIKYSLKAIRKLLPHMRDGKNLYEAMEACGYEDKDDSNVQKIDNRLTLNRAVPQIANPRVQKAVYATRRVVNAIIKKYGKRPVQINIEMARELKANKEERSAMTKQNTTNRKANETAIKELTEQGVRISRSNISKYKCWHDEQNCQCAYCYKSMSIGEVFSGRTEWEHILPQSEFKQNYMNRVVACWDCNREKGDRTPYEAWGDSERWSSIENKMEEWKTSMPKQKRKRILSKISKSSIGSNEDFCERALKDTQYITTVVADYFENKEGIQVQASRGMATSEIRYAWGLNTILPNPNADEDDDDKKKVRIDHRHHAIDAFVVALTSHKILMVLTEYMKYKRDNQKGDSENIRRQQISQFIKRLIPATWCGGDIRDAVKHKILNKNVAIQKKTKVQDALHEETIYGRSHYTIAEPVPEKIGKPFIRRIGKMLEHKPDSNGMITTDGKVEWINDQAIYEKVKSWYEENKDKTARNFTSLDIHQLPISHRCYTIRVKLEDAIDYVETEKWNPGSGRWIADQELHKILYQWKEKNNLLQENSKATKAALENNPPSMPARGNKQGPPIKRLRIAMKLGNQSVRYIPQRGIVQLGNNHHIDIFFNASEGTRKVRIASAMDVALRQSRKQPIIDKTPDPDWGTGWQYQTTIHRGDLVKFDTDDLLIASEISDQVRENLGMYGTSTYRVQKMSANAGGNPDVFFRLICIATVDNDYGLIRIGSAKNLAIQRIELGVLGS